MMRVVSPFRPFPAESAEHQTLGPFDWIAALRMLAASVRRSCGCETLAITDVDTDLPVPALQFETTERRLMVWIIEVSLRYLESPQFDRDTVMISPDMLVLGRIDHGFIADLGVLVRPEPKYQASGRTILNQAQWWRVSAQPALVAFYRDALAIAQVLPEPYATWGADTEPLRQLLEPIEVGARQRGDLAVAQIHASAIMESLSSTNIKRLADGDQLKVGRPILDFRYTRKHHMAAVFDALFQQAVIA